MTKQEMLDEWQKIMAAENVYIYGAAWGAKEIYGWLEKWGHAAKVKGFLVTEKQGNPSMLNDLPVMTADSLQDKSVRIVVPHLGDYRTQINEHLAKLEFTDVQNVGTLCSKTRYIASGRELPSVEDEFILPGMSQEVIDGYRTLRQNVVKLLREGSPDFGNYKPYQSLERIGLDGIRPTNERIVSYRLLDYLAGGMDVLDIGCNTGFLDMEVAGYVRSITGIEYDSSLQRIGKYVSEQLGIENVEFLHQDVKKWFNDNCDSEYKYDAIFSFAVHHWIDMNAHEYVQKLCGIMKQHTLLWLESHGKEYDPMYADMIDEFLQLGFEMVIESEIKDDKMTSRDFVLLRR